ncbi:MAG: 2-C-methyl-D-erythritol 4-phosphate cytidylyltransferase [Calditrichaeota bacterium]|nr:MAG: 2-C-methyl-D-erythritol 4-phosphate cytidylyltransferase [Calditrichota bacterium]
MFSVVIPAAGIGKRMNSTRPKQFLEINSKPILAYTLEKFSKIKVVSEIVISTSKDCFSEVEQIVSKISFINFKIVEGGKERQDSVFNGLKACKNQDFILVHDGVRPFVNENEILEVFKKAQELGGAILAVKVKDTIKFGENGLVKETPNREKLWSVQTPQGFRFEVLFEAERKAKEQNFYSTDESALVEKYFPSQKIGIIEGSYSNIKITSPEDLILAEKLLQLSMNSEQ